MLRDNFIENSDSLRWLRSLIDMITCFVMAVMLLRGFVLEGYLISTGSMAPRLRGFHKRIVCPSCQSIFAFGLSFDDSVPASEMTATGADGTKKYATCPNCGQISIDVTEVPNSHGDQLLVQKHIYDFRPPRRWEAIVFRNPALPSEAYVKRVVGLPGETIQVTAGEVFINGQMARKSFTSQRDMRISVANLANLSDAPDWQMPWELDEAWEVNGHTVQSKHLSPATPSPEKSAAQKLVAAQANGVDSTSAEVSSESDTEMRWIRFRNWRWFGGQHFSETPLSPEDARIDWTAIVSRFDELPIVWFSRIDYDSERQVLRVEGVMSPEMQRNLLDHAQTDGFRRAVYRLAALSHLAPVTDRYGYNAIVSATEYRVSDLALRTVLSWQQPPDRIQVDLPSGDELFEVRLDPLAGRIELYSVDHDVVLQTGTFESTEVTPADGASDASGARPGVELDVSNIDRQVTIAINGRPCFEPFVLPSPSPDFDSEADSTTDLVAPSVPANKAATDALTTRRQSHWRLGVAGPGVRVEQLQMYRDVYYTPGRRKNAVERPYQIPAGNYFVQGDNSPVSSDSRNWNDPCVPHHLLLGKPFLVHLPSRPAILQFGSRDILIRIPDWPRIGYIR